MSVEFKPMPHKRVITAGDLFCGAGGASAGLHKAAAQVGAKVDMIAVNHWDTAISTHSANFPHVRHFLTEVEKVDPKEAVPSGKLDLLLAGPSCVHFSQARGGQPVSDQQRSSASDIVKWAIALDIDTILVENVPAFLTWGPLRPKCDKKTGEPTYHKKTGEPLMEPDPTRKGNHFRLWVKLLERRGYTVEWRILCAAHFGDATTRKRLFVQCRKNGGRIVWPRPTHHAPADLSGFPTAEAWRPAREIIDWDFPTQSIYGRKKDLADNTIRRIWAGISKFSGLPFTLGQQSCATARSIDDPIATVATAGAISLTQAFVVVLRRSGNKEGIARPYSVDEPIPTVCAGGNHIGVCQSFLLPPEGVNRGNAPRSLDDPMQTVTSRGGGHLVETVMEPFMEPFIMQMAQASEGDERRCYPLERPLATLTTKASLGIVETVAEPLTSPVREGMEPFIVPNFSQHGPRSLDDPLNTITCNSRGIGLCEPALEPFPLEEFLVGAGGPSGSGKPASVKDPLGTVMGQNHRGLVQAFLVRYNGGERSQSLDNPLTTIDTSNRFGLAEPFLVSFQGNDDAQSLDDPLHTITTRDRFALVFGTLEEMKDLIDRGEVKFRLDIKFRMLQPHELAAAHSFPGDYKFSGGREDKVRQIGNSWPVNLGAALCQELIKEMQA